MITGTYKNVKPIDCSRTSQKKQLFLIDHFGYINSFLIDDFEPMLRSLRISRSLLPLLSDLIQAHIVFALSEKIGLKPGLFLEGDKAIIENLKNHISDMIDDEVHDEIVAKLIKSWNNIAAHPLTEHYQRLSQHAQSSENDGDIRIIPFDHYHFFMKNIFAGILNLWSTLDQDSMRFYMNFTELWFSTVECRSYRRNDFFNYDLLLRELVSYQKTVDGEKQQWLEERIQEVKLARNQVQEGCLTHVKGWIEFWLVNLEKKFSAADLGVALVNILKKRSRISNNFELNRELAEIYRFNMDPQGRNAGLIKFIFNTEKRAEMGEQEILRLITEAIEFVIIAYAMGHQINIYEVVFPLPESLLCLNLPEDVIVQKLLDKECNEPHQLYALYQTTQSALVKATIEDMVSPSRSHVTHSSTMSPISLSLLTGRSRIPMPLLASYSFLLPQIPLLNSLSLEESLPEIEHSPHSSSQTVSLPSSSSSSSFIADDSVSEERRTRFVGLPSLRRRDALLPFSSPLFTPGYDRLNALIRGQSDFRLEEDDPDGSRLAQQLDAVLDLRQSGDDLSEEESDKPRANGCYVM
ncbi:hypothetical protein CC99x_012160 [Candidatus Berkiella cookevillensis]|uniref:Uncharacterized protein n=1 Tax=Candidatus Berkiella cookevillensis TaxID=437022 RepID=A0A0Q9YPY7_9GAMM|nr:hypothetical protein [Candidatus Berkiella cookevillensis]MCS5709650.1 hypothetical protein [Candidatus Berkiella cookevillensis]